MTLECVPPVYIRLDNKFIDEAEPAIQQGLPVQIDCEVVNTDRALGTTLSYKVSKKYGEEGLRAFLSRPLCCSLSLVVAEFLLQPATRSTST